MLWLILAQVFLLAFANVFCCSNVGYAFHRKFAHLPLTQEHFTPLMMAIKKNNFGMVKFLLDNNANVNASTEVNVGARREFAILSVWEVLRHVLFWFVSAKD